MQLVLYNLDLRLIFGYVKVAQTRVLPWFAKRKRLRKSTETHRKLGWYPGSCPNDNDRTKQLSVMGRDLDRNARYLPWSFAPKRCPSYMASPKMYRNVTDMSKGGETREIHESIGTWQAWRVFPWHVWLSAAAVKIETMLMMINGWVQ